MWHVTCWHFSSVLFTSYRNVLELWMTQEMPVALSKGVSFFFFALHRLCIVLFRAKIRLTGEEVFHCKISVEFANTIDTPNSAAATDTGRYSTRRNIKGPGKFNNSYGFQKPRKSKSKKYGQEIFQNQICNGSVSSSEYESDKDAAQEHAVELYSNPSSWNDKSSEAHAPDVDSKGSNLDWSSIELDAVREKTQDGPDGHEKRSLKPEHPQEAEQQPEAYRLQRSFSSPSRPVRTQIFTRSPTHSQSSPRHERYKPQRGSPLVCGEKPVRSPLVEGKDGADNSSGNIIVSSRTWTRSKNCRRAGKVE